MYLYMYDIVYLLATCTESYGTYAYILVQCRALGRAGAILLETLYYELQALYI